MVSGFTFTWQGDMGELGECLYALWQQLWVLIIFESFLNYRRAEIASDLSGVGACFMSPDNMVNIFLEKLTVEKLFEMNPTYSNNTKKHFPLWSAFCCAPYQMSFSMPL